ncbi:MAG: transposase [Pseudomonadota bacterium]
MSTYIRTKSRGATIFFTVCLADRDSDLLLREIGLLRDVRVTRAERQLEIVAWATLPDHLHCIWRSPYGDGEFVVS